MYAQVDTYTALDGRKHARVAGSARTVLITQTGSYNAPWAAWYSDSNRDIIRGSFRDCVRAARRRVYPRP